MAGKIWVIIPAAGNGSRFNVSSLAKQYYLVLGKSVLEHTVSIFLAFFQDNTKNIIIPLSKNDQHFSTLKIATHPKIQPIEGGETRAESVLKALQALKKIAQKDDWVLVHDAARPCLSQRDLQTLIDTLKNDPVGGILGMPVKDTLKTVISGEIQETLNRDIIWHAFTPQMYRYGILLEAMTKAPSSVTDEATAVKAAQYVSRMVVGIDPNPKLTVKQDAAYITFLLSQKV